MGFLDWIKRGRTEGREPEPENESWGDWYSTKKGNAIQAVSEGKWESDPSGLPREFKLHVGRSVEGYHGGVEVSHQGGDGTVYWSGARPTTQSAERAAHGIREWHGRTPKTKPAPGTGQNEIRTACRMPGKNSTPAAKDKGHRWER
jgi:hypothetical protein